MFNYSVLSDLLLGDLDLDSDDIRDGCLSDDSHEMSARRALATSFLKKLAPNGNAQQADANAVIDFMRCNERLPADRWEFVVDSEVSSCFYDYFRESLNKTLGDATGTDIYLDKRNHEDGSQLDYATCSLEVLREHMDIGPGASQLANADNIVTKLFEGTMSTYGDRYAKALWCAAVSGTGLWAEAERLRSDRFGFRTVEGGKGFLAPKNAEISRFCCTEALMEMILQKGAGGFAEWRLKRCFGISLSTQPTFNRRMARQGSIDGTYGTIDLRSASNSIGLHMLDTCLDECSFKRVILATRAKFVVLPNDELVESRMVSTMGNGFTFPLQTIIFACAVRAVYQMKGYPTSDPERDFGVFGDDIVVRSDCYEFLCKMLERLGFEVNTKKSFNTGSFRESCGGDYVNGRNVRGVYIKSLETPQQICSAINRLNRWSARHGIELPLTLSYLMAHVAHAPRVPPSEQDESGIHVPFTCSSPRLQANYWFSYRCYVKRVKKVRVHEPDASRDEFESDELWSHHNPQGVAVGFLSGHIRRADSQPTHFWSPRRETLDIQLPLQEAPEILVPVRDRGGQATRHQIRKRAIPWWDYIDYGDTWEGICYDSWKAIVAAQIKCL